MDLSLEENLCLSQNHGQNGIGGEGDTSRKLFGENFGDDLELITKFSLDTKVGYHLGEFLKGDLRKVYFEDWDMGEICGLSDLVGVENKRLRGLLVGLSRFTDVLETYSKVIKQQRKSVNVRNRKKEGFRNSNREPLLDGSVVCSPSFLNKTSLGSEWNQSSCTPN